MKSKHEIKWGKNISIYQFYARSTLMHHIVWFRVLGCGRHMGYVRAQQLIHIKHDQLFNVCYFINLRPNNCMCNCFEPLIHCCTNLCIVLYLYRWDEQGGLSFHVILNDRTWFTIICSHANFLGGLLCRRLFFSGWVCLRLPMCVFFLCHSLVSIAFYTWDRRHMNIKQDHCLNSCYFHSMHVRHLL